MGIVSWLLLGLTAGVLAKIIMPGQDGGGWLKTIFVGIVGAFVGGYVGTYFGFGEVSGFNPKSIGVATFGAFLLLVPGRLLKKL